MRWLLLDKIQTIEKGRRAETQSRIPEAPYSAEVLLMEMMAQTGALLLGAEKHFKEDVVFAKIEEAQFDLDSSHPGEPLRIEAVSDQLRPEGAWIDGKIWNQHGRVIGQSRFMLAVAGHLVPGRTEPVTFHQAFMNHFQVREKICV